MNKFSGMISTLQAGVAVLAIFLSGCMVGPDYRKPYTDIPKKWASSQHIQNIVTENLSEQTWWQNFHDPVLNKLITKASSGNLDIKIAETRISQSRALRASAFAALMPTGDVMGGVNRQANQIGFPNGGSSALSSLVRQPFSIFKSGFDASWELDLFGGHRRDLESMEAELAAADASFHDIMISLLAEVARTYLDIRLYQAQLAIAQDTLASNTKTVDVARQRFNVGSTAGIDVTRAISQQEHAEAQIPYYSNLLAQMEYSMDVLLGEQPGITHALVNEVLPIPVSDKKLVLDAPSVVIANRPDIRKAERKLASATAQQGVAVAKFFPDISLSGFIGLFNTNASNFLSASSKSWGMGANILWPILSYGSLSASLNAAKAKQQEAQANYQKTIISALSDVERSFTAYTEQEKYLQSIKKLTAIDRHVYEIARERYQEGQTSFLEVLDAERSLYASRNQLAIAEAQTSQLLCAVYKSLGGSWKPVK